MFMRDLSHISGNLFHLKRVQTNYAAGRYGTERGGELKSLSPQLHHQPIYGTDKFCCFAQVEIYRGGETTIQAFILGHCLLPALAAQIGHGISHPKFSRKPYFHFYSPSALEKGGSWSGHPVHLPQVPALQV